MFKKAKWIWYDTKGTENSYGEFYGEFTADKAAWAKISCDGDYTLFINGQYVSSNQYGDFEYYKSVDEIDISPFTATGVNKIAILVWHFGKDTQRYKRYTPGVICEVVAGDTVAFATDEGTLCRQSQAYQSGFKREISSQLGFSYKYDSRKEDLWIQGQGKNMKKACPVDKKCVFVPRPNEKLRLGKPVLATKIGDNLYDLGKEYVGLLFLEAEAEKDTEINISYGECLEKGQVKRKIGTRDFSVGYVAGAGENRFTHYMLRFACRYLQVESEMPVKVSKIGLIPQHYPVKEAQAQLECQEDRGIYQACVNTLRLCMMEHYVDCPWREQCLYAFDSRNQMLSGYYAFEGGNFEYVKSNLLLMGQDKRGDGLLSICYPCGIDLTIPSFSLYYIVSVKEYIEHSGNAGIIEQIGGKLREIIDTFLANTKEGLVCTFEKDCHWNFYDWSPYADGYIDRDARGKADAMASLLVAYALTAYKKICKLCTLPFPFDEFLEELRGKARQAFFSEEKGAFLTNGNATELVNAFGILTGVATRGEAEEICNRLTKKELISCSLSMKCFVYDALIKTDREKYKSFILEDIRNTYKPMVEVGTVWETKEGATAFDNAGSLCHGWSSIPIYYYNILK